MEFGIKDRVAVITGGDSGMGHATAKLLAAEGVKIALIDKTTDELDSARAEIEKIGEAIAVTADLRNTDEVTAAKKAIVDHYGKVDILVNAAGITGATKSFLELTDDDWWNTINTDFMAAVRVCRAFVPVMQAGGWGRIVLFTSEDALQPYTDEMPYCAAKAAVLNFMKNLSKAVAKDGILVNSVSPAYIATPMTDKMMTKRAEEKNMSFDKAIETFLEEKRPHLELQRRGKAEEVAAVVAFLCSQQSSFIVGSKLSRGWGIGSDNLVLFGWFHLASVVWTTQLIDRFASILGGIVYPGLASLVEPSSSSPFSCEEKGR